MGTRAPRSSNATTTPRTASAKEGGKASGGRRSVEAPDGSDQISPPTAAELTNAQVTTPSLTIETSEEETGTGLRSLPPTPAGGGLKPKVKGQVIPTVPYSESEWTSRGTIPRPDVDRHLAFASLKAPEPWNSGELVVTLREGRRVMAVGKEDNGTYTLYQKKTTK